MSELDELVSEPILELKNERNSSPSPNNVQFLKKKSTKMNFDDLKK